ncbi:hemerythrin domain-containing protein [Streptomyces sp. NPDC127084]|uniref:hemerythrin domain-containing protein n=1 Tax=Streptomyces sp. NPDC127084 TaxID=3347133 RepID=UPI003659E1FF
MTQAAISEPMADVRDMYMAHRMFRREFRLLPQLVRDVRPGDTERAAIVADHADKICAILDAHHEGEDAVVWPLLLARGGERSETIVPVMEEQHHGIHEALTTVALLFPAWRATAQRGEELASATDVLVDRLVEHMAMEETEILPLAEQYVTAAEWAVFGEHAFSSLPKKTLALGFGMVMYEGDAEVIKEVLANAPFVPRLVMPRLGPRLYASHATRVHGTATPPRLGR